MLRKLKGIISEVYSRKNGLRERLFSEILLVGGVVSILTTIETMIVFRDIIAILPIIILMFAFFTATIVALVNKKVKYISIVVGLILNLIILPLVFIYSGGIASGSSVWLTLGILYAFLLFNGKTLAIILALTLSGDIFVYLLSYFNPSAIETVVDRGNIHFDSLFGVIVVGIAVGCVFHFQIKMYNEEREIALKQKNELEEMGKARSKFFASMSHELRTPINSIILLDEMIIREESLEQTRKYASNISNVSKMLLSLINDILDFSQLENNRMDIHLAPYKTEELLSDLIDMVKTRTDDKGLEFDIQISPLLPSELVGDKKRIQQILINILINAVKYTNEGRVTFSVYADVDDSNDSVKLTMSVADTGIGIKQEDINKLYDYYSRIGDSSNSKADGSGLGLAITKQLVDMMGGTITVDSIYTKGTMFTVIIEQHIYNHEPIKKCNFTSTVNTTIGEYRPLFIAPEAKILVVEDDILNADLATLLLSKCSNNVDKAYTAEECLIACMEKSYNVILLDYHLNDVLGTDIVKQIRNQKNGLCKNSRIILSSAESEAAMQEYSEKYNFDGYLEKPITYEKLEKIIYENINPELIEIDNSGKENIIERNNYYIKKKKVHITTDCISDLSDDIINKYDIDVMYLYIKTKNGRFSDTKEIDSSNVSQYVSSERQDVKVDSASESEYEEFYSNALTKAENIIHISMAKNAGKSYYIAEKAAKSFEHVHMVDSGHISCGQGLVVMYASWLAKQGFEVNEIIEKVSEIREKIDAEFIVPDIKIFFRNGYSKKAISRIYDVRHLHPVLKTSKSNINLKYGLAGSLEVAWRKFIRKHLRNKKKIDKSIVYIAHAGLTEKELDGIIKEIQKYVQFEKIIINKCSFSSACNTGVMTFGFAFFTL